MKRFYKENRVFAIMMIVSIICIIAIGIMVLSYVFASSTKSVYGNRLDGIKDVQITDANKSDMEKKVLDMEKVKDATINVHGKIIYFVIDFENEASIESVKNTAIKCLDFFEEDYKNYYDIEFLMTKSAEEDSEAVFPIMGALKAGNTTISWSNNSK